MMISSTHPLLFNILILTSLFCSFSGARRRSSPSDARMVLLNRRMAQSDFSVRRQTYYRDPIASSSRQPLNFEVYSSGVTP
ncbi:hypothetical protein DFH11DRAFT_1651593 [Phellopilus nigrolimitatus]|nr:hypothetical protein DFH11DRAFT_1651593 [Phellopilus nigrolimitatus]